MSAVFAKTYPGGICVLTDGATYNRTGALTRIGPKVWSSETRPVCVFGRGDHEWMRAIAAEIIGVADRSEDFDAVLDWLRGSLPALGPKIGGQTDRIVEIVVAGHSPRSGFSQYVFYSWSDPTDKAFELKKIDLAWGGARLTAEDWAEIKAIPMDAFNEGQPWFEKHGADVFEMVRRKPQRRLFGDGDEQYLVGGQVDLTTITDSGVETRTLRRWPDVVGETINPFKEVECGSHQ